MKKLLVVILAVSVVLVFAVPALARGHRGMNMDINSNNTTAESSAGSYGYNSNVAASGMSYASGNEAATGIVNINLAAALGFKSDAKNFNCNDVVNKGTANSNSGNANANQNGFNAVCSVSDAYAKTKGGGGSCGMNINSHNTYSGSMAIAEGVNENMAISGDSIASGNAALNVIINGSGALAACGGDATNMTCNNVSNVGTANASSGNANANQNAMNKVCADSISTGIAKTYCR